MGPSFSPPVNAGFQREVSFSWAYVIMGVVNPTFGRSLCVGRLAGRLSG